MPKDNVLNRHLEKVDEVGLLDLLILIAENFKLLVVGSVLVGMIAAGLAHVAPERYVSRATLVLPSQAPGLSHVFAVIKVQTPAQAAELMTSSRVLDPVIIRMKLSEGRPLDIARKDLMKQVKVSADPAGLLQLEVTSNQPEQAQTLANAVIESWLKSTEPTQTERAALEKLLAHAESSLNATRRLIERLSSETGVVSGKTLDQQDTGATLTAAADLQTRYLHETATIASLRGGYSMDVVEQAPTLPTSPESKPKGLIALLSALATAMALLLWILILQAWRSAAQDPSLAPKLLRLRNALKLR